MTEDKKVFVLGQNLFSHHERGQTGGSDDEAH